MSEEIDWDTYAEYQPDVSERVFDIKPSEFLISRIYKIPMLTSYVKSRINERMNYDGIVKKWMDKEEIQYWVDYYICQWFGLRIKEKNERTFGGN